MVKWLKKRAKSARLRKRAEEKRKDYGRPLRIIERLHLRIEVQGDIGKAANDRGDIEATKAATQRMSVLLARMRRVRDFQIREWGH